MNQCKSCELYDADGSRHVCADHPSCGIKTYTREEWCEAFPKKAADFIEGLLNEIAHHS